MKIKVLSDEDTNLMFRLVGIEGIEISNSNQKEFEAEFTKILQDPTIGIILINEKDYLRFNSFLKPLKLRQFPIIVEIPDLKAPLQAEYYKETLEKMIGLTI